MIIVVRVVLLGTIISRILLLWKCMSVRTAPEFDWEKYCLGWHSMTPQERVAFFLRDGLQSGKGEWGTTEATSNYQAHFIIIWFLMVPI